MSGESDLQNYQNVSQRITKNCEICKSYKKAPPGPILSFPEPSLFQESLAIDLKYYQGHTFFDLINMCTCLLAATFVPDP